MANRLPASGYFPAVSDLMPKLAVVMKSVLRSLPPKAQEVTLLAGTFIFLRSFPVSGSKQATQAPPHKHTHRLSSESIVIPSGPPIPAGISTAVFPLLLLPLLPS